MLIGKLDAAFEVIPVLALTGLLLIDLVGH